MQVYNKGSRQSEHQSSAIKEFSILCMEDASLWAHQISSICLSYLRPILLLVLQLLVFPQLLLKKLGAAASTGSVLGALIHIWRLEIATGCDIPCLLICQEIFSFHRRHSLNHWTTKPYKEYLASNNFRKMPVSLADGESIIIAQFPIKFTQLINVLVRKVG